MISYEQGFIQPGLLEKCRATLPATPSSGCMMSELDAQTVCLALLQALETPAGPGSDRLAVCTAVAQAMEARGHFLEVAQQRVRNDDTRQRVTVYMLRTDDDRLAGFAGATGWPGAMAHALGKVDDEGGINLPAMPDATGAFTAQTVENISRLRPQAVALLQALDLEADTAPVPTSRQLPRL